MIMPKSCAHNLIWRHSSRPSVTGVISFSELGTTVDCTVRNLSLGGACLTVTSPAGIPNEFDLMLDRDTITRCCLVAWRAADHSNRH